MTSKYTRTIKLAPSLGDWTTLTPTSTDTPLVDIRPIQSTGFDNLSKDNLAIAHTIHYRLGEKICEKLSSDMDIKVELHTVSISQLTYHQFVRTTPEQIIQADLVSPSGERINILLDWPLAEQIVNRLTGGNGDTCGSDEFTGLEADILETQMHTLADLLGPVWKNPDLSTNKKFEFYVGKYQENLKVSPRESYVAFEYTLIMGTGSLHNMKWAYPNSQLRTMLSDYETASRDLTPKLTLDSSTLSRTKISVNVILGSTSLPMKDLREIQPGDVLTLDTDISNPLTMMLGGTTGITVQPGVHDDKICAQVIFWDPSMARETTPTQGDDPRQDTNLSAVSPNVFESIQNNFPYPTQSDLNFTSSYDTSDDTSFEDTEPNRQDLIFETRDGHDFDDTDDHDHDDVEDTTSFEFDGQEEDESDTESVTETDNTAVVSDFETDDTLFDDDDNYDNHHDDNDTENESDDDFSWDDLEDEL